MNKILIGIDYSITSPAIAILKNNEYKFSIFPRVGNIKDKMYEDLIIAGLDIVNVNETKQLPKKSTITQLERRSMVDAMYQIDLIIDYINNNVEDFTNTHVAIEGLSFASTSSRLAQISGYQWLLRYKLINLGLPIDNMWIFAPNNVKLTAGKGNLKKNEMIDAFINNSLDEKLASNKLYLSIKNNSNLYQTKKTCNWLKPIDDICDSYWILKTVEKNCNL